MPIAPDRYTADMVRAMPPDGNRYEVVAGELAVTPAPRWAHQVVVSELTAALREYCARFRLGRVFGVAADISWSADTLVQPDVFVIAPEDAEAGDWAAVRRLSLVAEVLSPATARFDRIQKRRLYQAQRVGTIWLLDTERRAVEVWTPDATSARIETERLTWHPPGAPDPLQIDLDSLLDA